MRKHLQRRCFRIVPTFIVILFPPRSFLIPSRELIQAFENSFQIRLPNYHVTFSQIKARKANLARFLDRLKAALEYYMNHVSG